MSESFASDLLEYELLAVEQFDESSWWVLSQVFANDLIKVRGFGNDFFRMEWIIIEQINDFFNRGINFLKKMVLVIFYKRDLEFS